MGTMSTNWGWMKRFNECSCYSKHENMNNSFFCTLCFKYLLLVDHNWLSPFDWSSEPGLALHWPGMTFIICLCCGKRLCHSRFDSSGSCRDEGFETQGAGERAWAEVEAWWWKRLVYDPVRPHFLTLESNKHFRFNPDDFCSRWNQTFKIQISADKAIDGWEHIGFHCTEPTETVLLHCKTMCLHACALCIGATSSWNECRHGASVLLPVLTNPPE